MPAESTFDFTVVGEAHDLSRVIEEYAGSRQSLSALVVPWESDDETVTMAVTFVQADGWAIEHTNLGTIKLTDAGGGRTRVSIVRHQTDHPDEGRLAAALGQFAQQVRQKLETAGSTGSGRK